MREYPHQVQRNRHDARGGDVAHVHVGGNLLLLRVHIVMFARLQTPLARQVWVPLADMIQQPGKKNRH